jgi:ribosome-associated protein
VAHDLPIKNGITIPEHELEITASRAGGPGGQHVNKTSTRITIRWNVHTTRALSPEQRAYVTHKLRARLTTTGDLIIHSSTSRSQQQNKEHALARLATIVRTALHVPKKRIPTHAPKTAKEARLHAKTQRSRLKKLRSTQIHEY